MNNIEIGWSEGFSQTCFCLRPAQAALSPQRCTPYPHIAYYFKNDEWHTHNGMFIAAKVVQHWLGINQNTFREGSIRTREPSS